MKRIIIDLPESFKPTKSRTKEMFRLSNLAGEMSSAIIAVDEVLLEAAKLCAQNRNNDDLSDMYIELISDCQHTLKTINTILAAVNKELERYKERKENNHDK